MNGLAIGTLWRRELTRFFRQPSRIAGAAGSPLLFWILIGSGLSGSFRLPGTSGGMTYLEYFFPGTIVLVLLFAAIFSTISVIEDRREGFLQGALVAPVPRAAIVLGKILGGTALAAAQAGIVLLAAPLVGVHPAAAAAIGAVGLLILVGFALTSLSLAIAWRLRSTQGFHAIMTVFLMPLWLLSGAFFPAAGAPPWLAALMAANPLTYGVAALRHLLGAAAGGGAGTSLPGLPVALGLTLAFASVCFAAALVVAHLPDGGEAF